MGGENLSYNGLRQMGSSFQSWSMSEDSRVGILLRGSSVRVCLLVLNQGCYSSGQYNLLDRMLRLDANTTLNQSNILFITLVLTLHIRVGINISHLSIPGIGAHGRCYISHCFLFVFFSPGRCFKLFVV